MALLEKIMPLIKKNQIIHLLDILNYMLSNSAENSVFK